MGSRGKTRRLRRDRRKQYGGESSEPMPENSPLTKIGKWFTRILDKVRTKKNGSNSMSSSIFKTGPLLQTQEEKKKQEEKGLLSAPKLKPVNNTPQLSTVSSTAISPMGPSAAPSVAISPMGPSAAPSAAPLAVISPMGPSATPSAVPSVAIPPMGAAPTIMPPPPEMSRVGGAHKRRKNRKHKKASRKASRKTRKASRKH